MQLNGLPYLELNLPTTYSVGFGFLKLLLNFVIKNNNKKVTSRAVYYIKRPFLYCVIFIQLSVGMFWLEKQISEIATYRYDVWSF